MSSKQLLLAARKSNAKSMRRRAVTVLGIFAALAGTISHSDVARANLPSALFDKDEVDWASVRNLASEAFRRLRETQSHADGCRLGSRHHQWRTACEHHLAKQP